MKVNHQHPGHQPRSPQRGHHPTVGQQIIAGLTAFRDTLKSGKPLEQLFENRVLCQVNSISGPEHNSDR